MARGERQRQRHPRALGLRLGGGEDSRSDIPIEEVFRPGNFETQNDRYRAIVRDTGIELARRALVSAGLEPREITLVVSVSCSGFMIPVDAYVADALGMGPHLVRLPITESGCAGGVVALARAADYLTAHPGEAALLLALELSSLTLQRWDRSATNVAQCGGRRRPLYTSHLAASESEPRRSWPAACGRGTSTSRTPRSRCSLQGAH